MIKKIIYLFPIKRKEQEKMPVAEVIEEKTLTRKEVVSSINNKAIAMRNFIGCLPVKGPIGNIKTSPREILKEEREK